MSDSGRPDSGSRRASSIEIRIPQAETSGPSTEPTQTPAADTQPQAEFADRSIPQPEEASKEHKNPENQTNGEEKESEIPKTNTSSPPAENDPKKTSKSDNSNVDETSDNSGNQDQPKIIENVEDNIEVPEHEQEIKQTTSVVGQQEEKAPTTQQTETEQQNGEATIETDQRLDKENLEEDKDSVDKTDQSKTTEAPPNSPEVQELKTDDSAKADKQETRKTAAVNEASDGPVEDGVKAEMEVKSPTPKSHNLEAMQDALDTRKETGFVLSSQFEEKEDDNLEQPDQLPARELPEGGEDEVQQQESVKEPKHNLATTSVRFQTPQKTKDEDENTYMTEAPDSEFTQDGRESRESRTYSPAYFDTGGRRSPEGQETSKKTKKEKTDPKRAEVLARLNLSKPPQKYQLRLKPLKKDPDPLNKAPLNPNIYYAEVPKQGGHIKTPFYMQVDIPDGALDGNVRLKFEKQEFDRMKLGLSEDDMLCSYIVDLNMDPSSYCLRQKATLKMRILDKCLNKYDDTVILMARHFTWARVETKIESKNVNGEKHYYAVTDSQAFGKFVVINTKKLDRFIIATGGGVFKSTIVPEIQLKVEDNYLLYHSPQMIEMFVKETKDEAVKKINKEVQVVKGVEGKLVAASPLIEISKNLMGQTSKMKHGMRFPDKLSLAIPLPIPPQPKDNGILPKRNVVVVQKHTNIHPTTDNGARYSTNAYSKNLTHFWKDVTQSSKMAVDMVNFEPNEILPIKVSIPGKYMVLVFEEPEFRVKSDLEVEIDLDDVTNAVIESSQEYEANIMIHQKVSQPNIIFIHMVTSDAIQPIHNTMKSTNAWKQVYVSRQLFMSEWQPIRLEFTGDLKPTVNQMSPHMRFYSRRWQGYQIQLEATDEAFSSSEDSFTGNISFVEETDKTIKKTRSSISVSSADEPQTICSVDIKIERSHAKPYKPTVVKKIIPKATIYREYKMKWLQHLSEEEIERYRTAHGI